MRKPNTSRLLLSRERLDDLYIKKRLSMSKISQLYGISIGLVHKRIHEEGFQVKGTFSDHKHSRRLDPMECQRLSATHKGKVVSEESRMKMSEASKLHGPGHIKPRDDGYLGVYFPDHPDASADGYVMQHRLVMEESVGRRLLSGEVVHHRNRNRSDNSLNNLQLMTASEHMSMHMKSKYALRRATI